MRFIWYGANSWLLEFSGQRILLDPWLVGSLEFGGLSWLFRAKREQSLSIPKSIDLILLSQGLEDHSHPETLKQLDKSIPVAAAPKAARVCRNLGFQQVFPLEIGETYTLNNQITILATEGALTGIKPENGYVLTAIEEESKIYYEPHGFYPDNLKIQAPIDVVIGPSVTLQLPLAGAIVRGASSAIELVELLRPQYFLCSTYGDDGVNYEGLLNSVLKVTGGMDHLSDCILQKGLNTQVIAPHVNTPLDLSISKSLI